MQELANTRYSLSNLPPKVAQAYKIVKGYVDRRSGLFKIAALFLPPKKRFIARATYGFFRRLDDMVDEEQISLADFRTWREQADKRLEEQTDPFLIIWTYVRERYEIDPQLVNNMLDGIEMDIQSQRFKTFDDLLVYCHYAATSGAFLALPILGVKSGYTLDDVKPPLENLALAIELTDILWDIDEDRAKGRIYLPEDVLSDFGLTYRDIENRVYDDRFRRVMQHFARVAREYFERGWPVIECFNLAERLAAGFGATVFLAALDRIEQNDFDIYSKPVSFSKSQKLWLLLTYLQEYFGILKRSRAGLR